MVRWTSNHPGEPAGALTATALRRRLAASILLSLMLVSCSGGNLAAPSHEGVINVLWKLRSIQGSGFPKIEVHDPERLTLRFGDDGRTTVRADCNTCVGRWEITGGRVQLSALACTRAFCGSASLDAEYLEALASAATFSLADGVLTIEGGSAVLTFRQ